MQGHIRFVSTMLAGIMMTDGVLILSRPSVGSFYFAPTLEVLAAANIMGKAITIVHNCEDDGEEEDDTVKEKHLQQIREFTNMIISREVPVVEVCAQSKDNSGIEQVCREIDSMSVQLEEQYDVTSPALMVIGDTSVQQGDEDEEGDAAAGGPLAVTIHGRLVQGAVWTGQDVEVRPGVVMMGDDGRKPKCCPIILKVVELTDDNAAADSPPTVAMAGQMVVLKAITRDDEEPLVRSVVGGGLGGHVLGQVGDDMPNVYSALMFKVFILDKMFNPYSERVEAVEGILEGEQVLLTVGTMSTYGQVRSIKQQEEAEEGGGRVVVVVVGPLSPPTCARRGDKIFVSRKQVLSWHLIGHGEILGGKSVPVLA